MDLNGGEPTILDQALSHGEAYLDWPQGEWLYYSRGGIAQPTGSRLLERVNVATGTVESVTTFKKDDGLADSGVWRFQIAADLQRAVVRSDNRAPEPYGRITALGLVGDDGRLALARSTDRWSCATGMDPFGFYFMDGMNPHYGTEIREWETLAVVTTVHWAETSTWGPDTRGSGDSHYRNAWSANSQDWLCIHLGWSDGHRFAARGANQVLIDWVGQERIVVTDNVVDSYAFDCAGDFWVSSDSSLRPEVVAQPRDVVADEGDEVSFTVVVGGAGPFEYEWRRDGEVLVGATQATVSLAAQMHDDGASFRCVIGNASGIVRSDAATLTVIADTTAPFLREAIAVGSPSTVRVVFSEPVSLESAEQLESYLIDLGVSVQAAQRSADPAAVVLTTSALDAGFTYTLTVNGVVDLAAAANTIADESTIQFQYLPNGADNLAPIVDAGSDRHGAENVDILLEGVVTDDGLPYSTLSVRWVQVSGPGTARFSALDQPQGFVRFDAAGVYSLRLTGDDGELVASDDVDIVVTPTPRLEILQPAGGESWHVGTTHDIVWESHGVYDVRIGFSTDFGETWYPVEASVDVASPHWQAYPWQAPTRPTANALIRISDYFNTTSAVSGTFVVVDPRSGASDSPGCGCRNTAPGWAWLLIVGALGVARRRSTTS